MELISESLLRHSYIYIRVKFFTASMHNNPTHVLLFFSWICGKTGSVNTCIFFQTMKGQMNEFIEKIWKIWKKHSSTCFGTGKLLGMVYQQWIDYFEGFFKILFYLGLTNNNKLLRFAVALWLKQEHCQNSVNTNSVQVNLSVASLCTDHLPSALS